MRLISALPPRLVELILLFLKPITGFTRTFESWDDALAASRSYEDPNIVEMYRNAMKNSASSAHLQSEVQQREARLAMAILRVVAENGMDKGISVLDVGGATGAHRNLFSKLGICVARYDIVESTAVVDELKEFSDSDKTWVYEPSAEGYDLVLCSGTLQVLREGIASLAAWANISGWIIIDRTPVTDDARTVIRRQNVLLPGLRRTFLSLVVFQPC
jgi:putative methyltransferase (TIGR04325 family)